MKTRLVIFQIAYYLLGPLLLYLYMILDEATDAGSLAAGFARINASLLSNNGEGALFFIGLFLLGLLMSFSISRKNRENISYRLLRKTGMIS